MKRTYTVNFDTCDKKGEVVGFTHQYTLFVKYADKFFDTLRGLMPDFNIYVVRSIPVTADICAANEAIARFKLEKKFYTTDFIELGKFLAEIEEMDKKTLKPFLDKHEEKDDLPF